MSFPIPPLNLNVLTGLPLSHRFLVSFLAGGVLPNPLDIRFQRVSGLSASIQTRSVVEGGQNLYAHRLPERVSYDNLTLERGLVVGSPLKLEFNVAFTAFRFAPANVIVTLLSEEGAPMAAWMFFKAYPVRWSTADLDANNEAVLIETMELAYTRMQGMAI